MLRGLTHSLYIKKRFYQPSRIINDNNKKYFSLLLNDINYDPIENFCKNHETNCAYKYFINRITEAYEKAFPKKINSNKRNQKSSQPWMTMGILKATKVKSKLYLKYIKNPTANNKNKFI